MAKTDNLTDFLTDVANAIREKKGTTGAINPQDFSSEIASIESGGGEGGEAVTSAPISDVKFYDYDGTLLYSYSKEQFIALSAMPGLPTRDGLICQGWNWTLDDAKEYVTDYGMLNIGSMYITDDGDTRLYIRIASEGRMTLPLYWSQTAANGVSIDWGDGSNIQSFTGTGNKNTTHTYTNTGDYVIRLKVDDDCILGLGNGYSTCVMGGASNTNNRPYSNMLQSANIGKNVTSIDKPAFKYCSSLEFISIPSSVTSIGDHVFIGCSSLASVSIPSSVTLIGEYTFGSCSSLASVSIPSLVTDIHREAFNNCVSLSSVSIPSSVTSIGISTFYYCNSLSSVSIPSSVTSIGTQAFYGCKALSSVSIPNSLTSIGNSIFYNCYSLSSVSIPSSVTSIGNSTFYYCDSLSSVSIPSSVTSIGTQAFQYCYSLSSVSIPSSVTSIGANTFNNCYGMAIYDFTNHTSVPTLENTNAFTGIPSDCKIKVPESLLEEWKAATNWSTYANKIVAG